MNSLDGLFTVWCRVGWLWLLVFTASVLMVGALRRPCRKFFGAERAFLLWLLPLPSLLATLLPHVTKPASSSPPIVVAIATLPSSATASMPGVDGIDWRGWVALLWLTGAIAVLLITVYAQLRYHAKLRGAVGYGDISSRWPILRATEPSTGPALVGALRPRIVVPSDFDNRFDGNERAMILAHEGMHARRGDSYWNLLAMMVVSIFWFHPLAWWALSAFRRDQELACDAGVLRSQKGKRRCYANAMLKTQSAVSLLPVGCAWSPGHPLTERIAMLKQAPPGKARRLSGVVLMAVIIPLSVSIAYAASAPVASSPTAGDIAHPREYQLAMKVKWDDGNGLHGRVRRLSVAMCQSPDKAMRVSFKAMAVETIVSPLQNNRVRIAITIFDAAGHKLANPVLIGALGDPLGIAVGKSDGTPRYVVDITPVAGCPARKSASHNRA